MKNITLSPMLAMLGLGGTEIILILLALVIGPLFIIGVVFLVIWLVRRNDQKSPTTPAPAAPTRRFCHTCGQEMAADAPQGLCPACLMKVALGSEGGNPAGAGERKPAPPAADLAAHFPQLEILELLGQGGMGMVYKARQRQLDRVVALKILPANSARDPAFAERFSREAKALARLNHPNIVSVYDFGHTGSRRGNEADDPAGAGNPPPHVGDDAAGEDFYYFIMEFVDGVNLRQMESARRLTPSEALTIVPRICEALQYAHDEGIVHRDVKPENILIDKKGRVKIADFGLAKLLGHAPKDFRLTGSAHVMGTPHYMAPEQLERPLDVDHRADIYSLGVVFYEMLTGELPLGRFAPPSAKAQLDVRLDEVVLRSLEKEPQRRYQHISEVKTDVDTIVGSAGVAPAKPVGSLHSADQSPKPREDRFWKRFALGVALVVLAMIMIPVAAVLLAMFIPAFSKARSRQHEVQSAVIQQSQSNSSNAVFGPVIERMVTLGEVGREGLAFVNFKKSEVLPPPFPLQVDPADGKLFKRTAQVEEWIAGAGVDLAVCLKESNWSFLPLDTRLMFQEEGGRRERIFLDQVTVETAQAILANPKSQQGYTLSYGGGVSDYPTTGSFIFKTRGGNVGLLQITGFTNEPRGVKIRYKLAQAGAKSWSPAVAPGEKSDPAKVLAEAHALATQKAGYDDALQRFVWYHNHAQEFSTNNPSGWLIAALTDWVELGRRYPKARQTLVEIRDRKNREFAEGRGYYELFQEVANINQYMQDEAATVALFQRIEQQDAALAGQCYLITESLLMKRGAYDICLRHIDDGQARFDSFRRVWEIQKKMEQNRADIYQRMGRTNLPPIPPYALDMRKLAEDRFVGQTRTLIEILVGGGRKTEAQIIRDQAVATLDDARLKSAVSDAEQQLAAKTASPPVP